MCESRGTSFPSKTFLISHKVDQELEAEETLLPAGLSLRAQPRKAKSFS